MFWNIEINFLRVCYQELLDEVVRSEYPMKAWKVRFWYKIKLIYSSLFDRQIFSSSCLSFHVDSRIYVYKMFPTIISNFVLFRMYVVVTWWRSQEKLQNGKPSTETYFQLSSISSTQWTLSWELHASASLGSLPLTTNLCGKPSTSPSSNKLSCLTAQSPGIKYDQSSSTITGWTTMK